MKAITIWQRQRHRSRSQALRNQVVANKMDSELVDRAAGAVGRNLTRGTQCADNRLRRRATLEAVPTLVPTRTVFVLVVCVSCGPSFVWKRKGLREFRASKGHLHNGLLNRYTGYTGIEGSNPSPSAKP